MEKEILRKEILSKRDKLSLDIKRQFNREIFNKLIASDLYITSKKIFTYVSFGSEVDTIEFIKYALNDDKEVYVPKTDKLKKEMVAVRIHNFDNMAVDKWGILEPKDVDKNKIGDNFDLIIMPGVAFDNDGNRIGYGGGYYDKYIFKHKKDAQLLALAYDIQMVNRIRNEEHDIKVNFIISNK